MLERSGALVVGPIAKISVIRVLPYLRCAPFPYIQKHILSDVDNFTWYCLVQFFVLLLDVYCTNKRLTLAFADGRLNGLVLHRQLLLLSFILKLYQLLAIDVSTRRYHLYM